ncbi:MAG: hypothetical protein FJW38_15755 [Acidobacteria bacterium]|nr:hypothetical protein [Acidobacteriota bacterium]
MRLLHYVEIENFKRFGDRRRIELEHPSVLIGPNNCGKTTTICIAVGVSIWNLVRPLTMRLWHQPSDG